MLVTDIARTTPTAITLPTRYRDEPTRYEPKYEYQKVLIVDEHQYVINTHRMILQSARKRDDGFTVREFITATNGRKALELFKTNPDVDLIITDGCMPGLSGPEFARAVRHYTAKKGYYVPIVLFSANVRVRGMIERAVAEGLADYGFEKGAKEKPSDYRAAYREILELREYFRHKVFIFNANEEEKAEALNKDIKALLESFKVKLSETQEELNQNAENIGSIVERIKLIVHSDPIEAFLLLSLARRVVGWNFHPVQFIQKEDLSTSATEHFKHLISLVDSIKANLIRDYGPETELNSQARERIKKA